jgi:hypothetical protein
MPPTNIARAIQLSLYVPIIICLPFTSVGQQFGLSGGMSMSGVLSTRGVGSPAGYPAAATSTRGSFGALGPQSQRVPTIVPANQVTL